MEAQPCTHSVAGTPLYKAVRMTSEGGVAQLGTDLHSVMMSFSPTSSGLTVSSAAAVLCRTGGKLSRQPLPIIHL